MSSVISRGVELLRSRDGTQAILNKLQPGVIRKDISEILNENGILTGIDWNAVDKAINKVSEVGELSAPATIAASPYSQCDVICNNLPREPVTIRFHKLKSRLRELGKTLPCPPNNKIPPNGIFCESGKVFMQIPRPRYSKHLDGSDVDFKNFNHFFIPGPDIKVGVDSDKLSWMARKSGYVYIDKDEQLCIHNPVNTTDDNMAIYYLHLPVFCGFAAKERDLLKILEEYPEKLQKFSANGCASAIKGEEAEYIILKIGRKPVKGEDAAIKMLVGSSQAFTVEQIDFKQQSPYTEVQKGDLLAEKTPFKKGINGEDVFGNEIPVSAGNDIKLNAGDNVSIQNKNGLYYYFSEINGILHRQDGLLSIHRDLEISGDVNIETGNLNFSRDIFISGGVMNGFKIVCGGWLKIGKNIENGAKIECNGDMDVNFGILGERTEVRVKGNLKAGYIVNAKVRVEGDMEVQNYICNANVFCSGGLTVRGRKVTSTQRGSVIGGRVGSMSSINLRSVGTYANKTEIYCGVHFEYFDTLQDTQKLLSLLDRKILTLQSGTKLNLKDNNISSYIKRLSDSRKKELKSVFIQIKELVNRRDQIFHKRNQLETKTFAEAPESVSIRIEKQLIPDVCVRIGRDIRLFQQELNAVIIHNKNSTIHYAPLI